MTMTNYGWRIALLSYARRSPLNQWVVQSTAHFWGKEGLDHLIDPSKGRPPQSVAVKMRHHLLGLNPGYTIRNWFMNREAKRALDNES